MQLVTGGLTVLGTLVVKLLFILGKGNLCVRGHWSVIFLLVHTIGPVCTYKEWVPDSFKPYPKDVMQWHIIINYIIVNSIPIIDFRVTTVVMFPILLISYFLQLQEETKALKYMFSLLPAEVQALSREPDAYFYHQMQRIVIIGSTFVIAHYIQQLDLSRIVVQKHMIQKSQQQLDVYFKD